MTGFSFCTQCDVGHWIRVVDVTGALFDMDDDSSVKTYNQLS